MTPAHKIGRYSPLTKQIAMNVSGVSTLGIDLDPKLIVFARLQSTRPFERLAAFSSVVTYWASRSDPFTASQLKTIFMPRPANGAPTIIRSSFGCFDFVLSNLEGCQILILALLRWEYETELAFGVSEALLAFFSQREEDQLRILQTIWNRHHGKSMDPKESSKLKNDIKELFDYLAAQLNSISF